jgi:hypothetical protein
MKTKLIIAAVCTFLLAGCTLAVTDGWHDHDYRPHRYHGWHEGGWGDGHYRH